MLQANFTVTPLTGYVTATDFTVTNLTSGAAVRRYVWDFGRENLIYNVKSPTHVYDYPGVYTISLSATDFNGYVSTYSQNVSVELAYRDYIRFTQIPERFADPGKQTDVPFKIEIVTPNVGKQLVIDLFAANSNSTPYQFVPERWSFLNPVWKFLDIEGNVITKLNIEPVSIYKNNKVVAVSGAAEFYFVDSMSKGDPTVNCPILITATLQTSSFNYPFDSKIYPYNSYANNQTVRAGVIWQVNDLFPNLLKITGNYIDPINSTQWKGIKIPTLITCHSNRSLLMPGAEDSVSEPIFAYPRNNQTGLLAPITLTLTNVNSADYSVDEAPLYFQSTDNNNSRIGGYIFTTITPKTTAQNTSIIAKGLTLNTEQYPSNTFPYPYGFAPNTSVWVSNPQKNTLNKITLVPDPGNCNTINYFRSNKILVDGIVKEVSVPAISSTTAFNYSMSGFSGIYGVAIDPRDYSLVAADAELDRLYRISNTGDILKTFNLSSIGDYNPNKKMLDFWTWKTPAPQASATRYLFYKPTLLSPYSANYIVTLGGVIQPASEVHVYNEEGVIYLDVTLPTTTVEVSSDPFLDTGSIPPDEFGLSGVDVTQLTAVYTTTPPPSADNGLSGGDTPPLSAIPDITIPITETNLFPPENLELNVIQIFNPYLPDIYASTLMHWTSTTSSITNTVLLTGSTSTPFLKTITNYYIVSIDGVLQRPDAYTINNSTKQITFTSPVPENSVVHVLYLPNVLPPATWTKTFAAPTTTFTLDNNNNYISDIEAGFIVNIGGVLQNTESYIHDIANNRLVFKQLLPPLIPITVTQITVPETVNNIAAYTPAYVSLDREMNIWVSLFNSVSVLKFDSDFNLLMSVAPSGIQWQPREGTVIPPADLSYLVSRFGDDYNIVPLSSEYYQQDWYNDEYFLKPPVVETDKDSNCWVTYAHPLSSMIVKYSSTGQPLLQVPTGQYASPINLAINTDNNVWVSNFHGSVYTETANTGNLQLYNTSTGNLLNTIRGINRPGHLAIDKNNNLWFTCNTRDIGYYNTTTQTLSTWTLSGSIGFIPSRAFQDLSINQSQEDDEIGGLAVDVFNRVWVLDSLNNRAWVVSATPMFNTTPVRSFKIIPDVTLGYYVDLQTGSTVTESGDFYYRSAQATGDWTGNRWYQKYATPLTLSSVAVSGISDSFNILEFVNTNQIRRINESFNNAEYFKSLALPENLQSNPILFDKFFAATVGTGYLSANEDLGQTIYEKIANFITNHSDIDTCNIGQLLSLAEETGVAASDYSAIYPTDIRTMLDIASVSRAKLWGVKDNTPILSECLCDQLNTETSLLTAGTKIILRSKFDNSLNLIPVPIQDGLTVYPLRDFKGYGFAPPVTQNYLFYNYKPVLKDNYIENIIDWDSEFTTLSPTASTVEQWYGDNGAIETAFRYLLTKNLFPK